MRRPRTIPGLIVEVIRLRGPGRARWIAAALTLLASVAITHRARRPTPTAHAYFERERASWQRDPDEHSVFLGDASVIATPGGWLLSWIRWQRERPTTVHVAALDRAGALRGAAVTVSSSEGMSRHPRLARGPRGNALVWAESAPNTFAPHVRLAIVDDDARVTLAARPVGTPDDETVAPQAAWDGEGWGVGWPRLRGRHSYTLLRLAADGSPRSAPTSLDDDDAWFDASLVWTGSAWLITQVAYEERPNRSAVTLTWVERSGRVVARRELARSSGAPGEVTTAAHDGSAWIVWGEDAYLGARHDPRFARIDDRSIAQPPRPLGPRRSGSVPAIACAGDGCTLAWTEVPEHGDAPVFYVQRVDGDGAPQGPVRRVGHEGRALPRFTATIATSLDGRASLAVWPAAHADRGRLLIVALDGDGALTGPPRELDP